MIDLFVLSFLPFAAGYAARWMNSVLSVGWCIAIQTLFCLIWLFMGFITSRKKRPSFQASVIAHSAGILAFALFIWQYLMDDLRKHVAIAEFASAYSSSVPLKTLSTITGNFGMAPTKLTPIILFLLSTLLLFALFYLGARAGSKKWAGKSERGPENNNN